MTVARFDFQRGCARRALRDSPTGLVLNVGANNDPGRLKDLDRARVWNCDLFADDQTLGHANRVDVLFDCARDRWPFRDAEAALVVFGDILEHLSPDEIAQALMEARRVSQALCITVPMDDRETTSDEEADKYARGAVHRTAVTEALLRKKLEQTGWIVTEWHRVRYGEGPGWSKPVDGFFVCATPGPLPQP